MKIVLVIGFIATIIHSSYCQWQSDKALDIDSDLIAVEPDDNIAEESQSSYVTSESEPLHTSKVEAFLVHLKPKKKTQEAAPKSRKSKFLLLLKLPDGTEETISTNANLASLYEDIQQQQTTDSDSDSSSDSDADTQQQQQEDDDSQSEDNQQEQKQETSYDNDEDGASPDQKYSNSLPAQTGGPSQSSYQSSGSLGAGQSSYQSENLNSYGNSRPEGGSDLRNVPSNNYGNSRPDGGSDISQKGGLKSTANVPSPAHSSNRQVLSPNANAANPYESKPSDMSRNTYNGLPPSPTMSKVFKGRGQTFGGFGNSHTGAPAGGFGTAPQKGGRIPPGFTPQGRPDTGSPDPYGVSAIRATNTTPSPKLRKSKFLLLLRLPDGTEETISTNANLTSLYEDIQQQQTTDSDSNSDVETEQQKDDDWQSDDNQQEQKQETSNPSYNSNAKGLLSNANAAKTYESKPSDISRNTYSGLPPSPTFPKVFKSRGPTFGGFRNSPIGAQTQGFGTAPQKGGRTPPAYSGNAQVLPSNAKAANPYESKPSDMSRNTYSGLPPSPTLPKVLKGRGPTFGGFRNSPIGVPTGGFGIAPQKGGRIPPAYISRTQGLSPSNTPNLYESKPRDMSRNTYNGLPPSPTLPKVLKGGGPTFGGYGNSGFRTAPQKSGRTSSGFNPQGRPDTGLRDPYGMPTILDTNNNAYPKSRVIMALLQSQ